MKEQLIDGTETKYTRSIKFTPKSCNHKVIANKDSYAVTWRGPWDKTWTETRNGKEVKLTHGRIEYDS